MVKFIKISSLLFLVMVIMFASFSVRAEAFSLNPIIILQNTTEFVITRVSDIISYIIKQEKYLFGNYSDPNVYPSTSVPANLEPPVPNNKISTSSVVVSGKPIVVPTPTLPSIKKTTPPPTVVVPNQIVSPVPGLVVKSSSTAGRIGPISADNDNLQILNFTNTERSAVSLKPLSANSVLDKIASWRADDLFANQYFEHASPDGKSATDLAKKVGYDYLVIGENLALGNFDGNLEIISAWMASPGHKANILNEKYEELGVSVKDGIYKGEKTTIAVQIFAKPLADCPKPNQATKDLIDSSSVSVRQMQAEATVMFNNISALKNTPQVDISYYNQKVQEYNYFAKKINEAVAAIKAMINSYNIEVGKYNSCVNS